MCEGDRYCEAVSERGFGGFCKGIKGFGISGGWRDPPDAGGCGRGGAAAAGRGSRRFMSMPAEKG